MVFSSSLDSKQNKNSLPDDTDMLGLQEVIYSQEEYLSIY